MPGAWEIRAQNQVLAAVLHVDTTTFAWSIGVRNLMIPGHIIGLAGMPFDHARNEACKLALQNDFKYLFFLDSDVIPPRDAILRLIQHNQPIISGMYCRRSPPHGIPVAIKNGQWVHQVSAVNPIMEVDYVGAGCLLIRRDVLEKFAQNQNKDRPGKTWFDWRVDLAGHTPEGTNLSEDFTFCRRAKQEFGYQVLLDTSIRCRHVGFAQADYHSMLPLDSQNYA